MTDDIRPYDREDGRYGCDICRKALNTHFLQGQRVICPEKPSSPEKTSKDVATMALSGKSGKSGKGKKEKKRK